MTDAGDPIRAEMLRILLDKGIVRDEDIPYAMEIAEELAPVALRLHDTARATQRERYELLRTVERVRAFVDGFAERGGGKITAGDELWIMSIRRELDGES